MNDTPSMPSDPTSPSGERRQVTVLFADMVGFTTISERLGEEGTYALIQPIYELMAGAVKEQGGSVKDFTGDGIMALFGAPEALEDAPLRACRAALLIHERLAATAPTIEGKLGVRPQMRIGVNSGLAVVTQVHGESAPMTALGDTVNLASRLQTLAEPGTVCLSEATQRLVQGLVETTFGGTHSIKGKAEPQRVYRLDSVRPGATRFQAAVGRGLTTFVGREREMEILERGLAEARSQLRVIDIVAEPGMGKSRLLHEFRQRDGKSRSFTLAGSCSPSGQQTPFLPFIEVVRGSFRVVTGEAETVLARKLDDGLKLLGLASAQNLGLLLNLLGLKAPEGVLQGLDATLIGLRTRDLLQQLLQARCRLSPTVMLLEDLHWIDSASEELLGKMVESGDALPLMILHTRRPEYRPPWFERPNVSHLRLEPLSAGETSRIVQARIGADKLPEALARLVAEKAEGNALFAEETASFLVERGMVRRAANGLEFDAAAVERALPGSVQSLIASRVGRLSAPDRALLQAAAVIGRRFDSNLLATVSGAAVDVEARLTAMQALDLVYQDDKSDDYIFKHALVRDVLYDGLLSIPCAAFHLKAAAEIERRSGNRLGEVADDLAYHYGRANSPAKAFQYGVMAGTKSLGVYSLDEAERHFRKALEIADTHPNVATDRQLTGLMERFTYLLNLNTRSTELCAVVEKYATRMEQIGDSPDLVLVLHHYGVALFTRSMFREARVTGDRAFAIADRLGDHRARAYARASRILCSTIIAPMSPEELEREGQLALEEAKHEPDGYIENWIPFVLCWDFMHRFEINRAKSFAHNIVQNARERSDPRALGLGLWSLGWVDIVDEQFADALAHGEEGEKVAILPVDRLVSTQVKGVALIGLRQVDDGSRILTELREQFTKNDWRYNFYGTDLILSLALIMQGKFAKGISQIRRHIAESERQGYRLVADWARVLLAEVYLELLTGKEKPGIRVLLQNLVFLIRTLPFAAQMALRLLLQASANQQIGKSTAMAARISFGIGLACKIKKRGKEARVHFEQAREIAEPLKAAALLAKIDTALAELP
jgi:class 3 adenylate cyclase/tetratricopeptide (TPR) repeat protein